MAKLGRYAAQRRKVEDVTASKTLTAASCGTLFTCGGATATLTLPTVADCGKGWWAEFWVDKASPAATTIQAQGTNLVFGFVITIEDNDPSVNINPPATTTGTEQIVLTTSCVAGDHVKIWCDGTNYYLEGQSQIVNAITAATE